eukprot:gene1193-1506_t
MILSSAVKHCSRLLNTTSKNCITTVTVNSYSTNNNSNNSSNLNNNSNNEKTVTNSRLQFGVHTGIGSVVQPIGLPRYQQQQNELPSNNTNHHHHPDLNISKTTSTTTTTNNTSPPPSTPSQQQQSTTITTATTNQHEYLRTHHSVLNLSLDQLISMHNKRSTIDLSYVPTLDPQDVYINSELKLSEIQVFGFDYDYTLANYSDQVQHLIYDLSITYLVDELRYPTALKDLKYDPHFAIRGLHYDMSTGLLMKLDFLHNIQAGALYYGRKALSKEEIISIYGSTQLKRNYHDQFLRPMSDIFCLPEASLISDITQFLVDKNYSFEPRIIYEDISKAINKVHLSGALHNRIINDFPLYLNKHPLLGDFLLKLKNSGKKLFLLTNNSFFYANHGMKYLLNDQIEGKYRDWTELFDVIITQCDKPSFFGKGRPFRAFDMDTGKWDWSEIKQFVNGKVYVGGSLQQFTKISQWSGRTVMYFGDHLYADLVEPSQKEGWRTGIIIKELESEVEIQNSPKYRENLAELLEIEDAIRRCQFFKGKKKNEFLEKLKTERYQKRLALKEPFNQNFGSCFRTHSNATLFAFNVHRHADIYTSKIENLFSYPLDYSFYPARNYLAHEFKLN